MRKWLLAVAILLNHGLIEARAQDVSVTLTVNQADLALVSKGLGGLPFAEVAPLMNKLQGQVIEQQKAKAAPNGPSPMPPAPPPIPVTPSEPPK